jgi:tRNA-specific 2-thiouridylase
LHFENDNTTARPEEPPSSGGVSKGARPRESTSSTGAAKAGQRVVVGMSGGVDSSVAAALLVEAGYEVIGVSMRLWTSGSESRCCSGDDCFDARRVAARLRIPFYVVDSEEVFTRAVVEPFVAEYMQGRTPNPCVRCNQFVKFHSLWERARALGGQWIATGHYARVRRNPETGRAQLWSAVDGTKDQSYFLFAIDAEVLQRTLFPLGELTKAAVRARARALGLPVAEKPESQEVCFVPKGEYAGFVAQRVAASARPAPGVIVDNSGRVLARHNGVHQFTIGQRRGLGVSAGAPLYVTAIDAQSGTVQVGPRAATVAMGLVARDANWLGESPVRRGTPVQVKIRSRFAAVPAVISAAAADGFELCADAGLPAVTPGQAAVLYRGQQVIGGGWIERALHA